MFRLRLAGAMSVIGALFFCVGITHAMQVEPPIFDLVGEPGQTIKGSFTVKNEESRPEKYYFSMQKFLPQGESGDQTFLPPTELSGLPEWTYLSEPSTLLAPGQEAHITFSIRIPADAARGSAQEAIFVSTAPPQEEKGAVAIGVRVGLLVFLRIGAVQESHLRFSWINQPPSWAAHLPIPIQITLENQGGAYEIPQGFISVRNLFGQERARIPFNAAGSRILTGSRRSFSLVWQDRSPATTVGFWANVGEELANGGIGPYTLTFEAARGTSLPTTKLFRVYLWPVHVICLVVFLIAIVCALLFWTRRRLVHRFVKGSL